MSPLPSPRALTAIALSVALCATGCGGGSPMSPANPAPGQTPATAVQINMGDAPSDWMLAFSMQITAMSLTGSGTTATVVSSSVPMEMMHANGTMQPLAMVSMPQGTYTGATITMGSITATYMDPNTQALAQKTLSGPVTAKVNFSSPIAVGPTPMALGFDLNLMQSVSLDANGNLMFNPVFQVSSGMQGSGNPTDFRDGGILDMMGVVASVSGNAFTMTAMQAAQPFTFLTNSSTTFPEGSLGSLAPGMTVLVDARMQSDGSLLATRIWSMMDPNGMMSGGIVTALAGLPATSLTMILQNGAGSGMMGSYFADGATVNIASSATFGIDRSNVDLSGLPFTPTFDASHIYVGQSVMPVSTSAMTSGGMMGGGMMGGGMMAGTISASAVYLEPQGLSGTASSAVSPSSTSSFVLTLPAASAFTTLTHATSITVYQQTSTIVSGASAISSGSPIHAYGLLFFDAGQWKMVCSRISAN